MVEIGSGAHPHTPGVPPPPHVSPPVQLHVLLPPQPSGNVPHLPPVHGSVGVHPHLPATPPPPHVFEPLQPQLTDAPHELVSVPQLTPSHGLPLGVHPQVLALPPPPHVLGATHAAEPQSTGVPQLFLVMPHSTFAHVVLFASATH